MARLNNEQKFFAAVKEETTVLGRFRKALVYGRTTERLMLLFWGYVIAATALALLGLILWKTDDWLVSTVVVLLWCAVACLCYCAWVILLHIVATPARQVPKSAFENELRQATEQSLSTHLLGRELVWTVFSILLVAAMAVVMWLLDAGGSRGISVTLALLDVFMLYSLKPSYDNLKYIASIRVITGRDAPDTNKAKKKVATPWWRRFSKWRRAQRRDS